jgi:hypothetical protein
MHLFYQFNAALFCFGGRLLSDLLTGYVTQHIGVDVQPDIADVVIKFGSRDPDDLADRTFVVMGSELVEQLAVHSPVAGEHGDKIQQRFFLFRKQGARLIAVQLVEFCLVHGRHDGPGASYIQAKRTYIDVRHLLANEHHRFGRQLQFAVQLCNFTGKRAKADRHPDGHYFQRCDDFAEAFSGIEIKQLPKQALRLFDR